MPKKAEKQNESEYTGLVNLIDSVKDHAAKAKADGTHLPHRLFVHLRRAANSVKRLEEAQLNPTPPPPMTDLQKAKLEAVLAKNKAKADKAKADKAKADKAKGKEVAK